MAKSTGKFGSLNQLKPLQGDIATDILNREDQQFKYREEKRINEDRASAKKLAERNELKDAMELYTALNIPITGSESIDEINTKTIMAGSERQNTLIDMMANQDKYSKEQIISAYTELKNLKQLPDNLLAMSKAQTDEKLAYDEKVKSGKLFRNEDYEKRFQGDYKNIGVVLKNGMPVTIFRKGNSDINLDGKIDEFDYETMGSLSDASQRPEFVDRYDFKSTIKTHADGIGKKVNSMVGKDGYSITEVTGLTEDVLQQTVKGALYGANGSPTGLMKSFIKEDGLDIDNPKHLEQVYNKYENELRMAMDSGSKVDPNNSDRINAAEFAYRKSQDAKKENATPTTSAFTLSVDEKGRELTVVKDAGAIKKGYSQYTIPKTDRKSLVINGVYTEIDEVYRDPKSGKLSFGGWEQVLKDGVWTNTKRTSGALSEGSKIATELGYDVQELSTELGRVRDEKLGKSQTFSASDEKLIKDNLEANPGYSREEIIAALKLKQ